ncbi:MAG: type II toxin-antitoxin system VapB family antitoxin [Rhodospirillaceae bacterium]|nr:type II toxin-antitoxin system VapB family antitoxin [Rhodospirillaceae bacterium]
MKTTLNIDDTVMAKVKREAAKRGMTMGELVETALRTFLNAKPSNDPLPPLPSYSMGPMLVDIADRDALYDAMERE